MKRRYAPHSELCALLFPFVGRWYVNEATTVNLLTDLENLMQCVMHGIVEDAHGLLVFTNHYGTTLKLLELIAGLGVLL